MDTIIIIPARLAATRLPSKPILDIAGKPMIIRVIEAASKANIGDVIAACGDQEIYDIVTACGYKAVMTDPDLPSGSDRVYEAYTLLNLQHRFIINLQADLPNISPYLISRLNQQLITTNTDVATLAAKITLEENKVNPNIVKVVIGLNNKAIYFTRSKCPYGVGDLYQHIGVYGYKRESLRKYVNLSPSPLEIQEKLEQLRAIENDMNIAVTIVESIPSGVDTQNDLERVRKLFL